MATKLTKKTSTPIKPNKEKQLKSSNTSPKMVTPKQYTYAVGRRRVATARIRLFKGKQEILVNGRLATDYWPTKEQQSLFLKPFVLTDTLGQYTATAKIKGEEAGGHAVRDWPTLIEMSRDIQELVSKRWAEYGF